jgi:hypothetical protein
MTRILVCIAAREARQRCRCRPNKERHLSARAFVPLPSISLRAESGNSWTGCPAGICTCPREPAIACKPWQRTNCTSASLWPGDVARHSSYARVPAGST